MVRRVLVPPRNGPLNKSRVVCYFDADADRQTIWRLPTSLSARKGWALPPLLPARALFLEHFQHRGSAAALDVLPPDDDHRRRGDWNAVGFYLCGMREPVITVFSSDSAFFFWSNFTSFFVSFFVSPLSPASTVPTVRQRHTTRNARKRSRLAFVRQRRLEIRFGVFIALR